MNVTRAAGNCRLRYKLHRDVGIDGADVLIEFVAIQDESNVNVGTNMSV